MTAPTEGLLNGICPYFTMFPLGFPLGVLRGRASTGDWVLDPFAGRGTTNYASRLMGLPSVGIDSNPVAAALTDAKLANATPAAIVACARRLLRQEHAVEIPDGPFWRAAYHPEVLGSLCRLRDGLLGDCRSDVRRALRAILLGALHGPRNKGVPSYFSNQCPRTYAPKPRYATNFWRARAMQAPNVDVLELVAARARRYYAAERGAEGTAIRGDSRDTAVFARLGRRFRWIVTSPPYYGMRTYVSDQWLRHWFVGGTAHVDYSQDGQLAHGSPEQFADQLAIVWANVATVSDENARLVIRFGGIQDRKADPLAILKQSLSSTPWRIMTVKGAGTADAGRRQAASFARTVTTPRPEYDVWATRSE